MPGWRRKRTGDDMTAGLSLPRASFRCLIALAALLLATPTQAVETSARQAIVVDYETGTVLFEKNAAEPVHPASMSKLMTLYVLFDRLKQGRVSLDDEFPVSEAADRKSTRLNSGP